VITSVFRFRRRRESPSTTARVVAVTRAEAPRAETPDGDRRAEDRLCETLRPRIWMTPEGRRRRIAARTEFVDGEVIDALDAGVGQVVIVGAGYDCRALRLRSPGTRFFEIDHRVTQEDKRKRLGALGISRDDVAYLPVDLAADSLEAGLDRAGYRFQERSLFVCEGLLLYLSLPAIRRLLSTIAKSAAPESRLILTARVKESGPRLRSLLGSLALAAVGESARTSFTRAELVSLLSEYGFAVAGESIWPDSQRQRQTLMLAADALGQARQSPETGSS
jgi:methyltransferase (TIGR00027 family)